MAIIIKKDGTVEPFNLKLLRQTKWNLMAPTRDRTEEADEYDGEIDFGAEFQSQSLELHCITEEGLSIEEKHQKKVEIADTLNNLRDGDWLMVEHVPDKKIFAHFAGRVQIEEYPSWLRVTVPLRLDPFWVSAEENEFTGNSGTIENAGTFETPVIVEILAESGNVENPSITIGEEEIKYNGVIDEKGLLKIDTDKMTVVLRQPEIALSPTFSRDSTAYQQDGSQVAANVPRFEQGKFDKALLVEEGTENHIGADGDFENDSNSDGIADGWFGVLYGAVPSLVSDPWTGLKAQRITSTSGDTGQYRRVEKTIAITGGQTYTFSAYLKTDGAATGNLRIDTNGTTPVVITSVSNSPTQYERHEISFTAPADATQVIVRCYNYISRGQVGWVQWDGAQLEKKPYPTSFTPGTRSPESLTIPTAGVLNPQEGAVAFWYKTGRSSSIAPSGKHDNFFGLDSKLWSICQANGIENSLGFWVGDSWGGPGIQTAVNWDEGDILFIVARWKLPDIYLDVWNYTKSTYAFGSATGVTYTGSPTLAYVNCGFGSFAGYNNGLIDELAIFDYAPTDEEIAAWHNGGEPIPVGEHTTYLLRFDNNLIALQSKTTNALANYEGGFPKLPPGNTDVSVTADIGTPTVTFKWHDRWV